MSSEAGKTEQDRASSSVGAPPGPVIASNTTQSSTAGGALNTLAARVQDNRGMTTRLDEMGIDHNKSRKDREEEAKNEQLAKDGDRPGEFDLLDYFGAR